MSGLNTPICSSAQSIQRQLRALDAFITILGNTTPNDVDHLLRLESVAAALDEDLSKVTDTFVPGWAETS